MASRIAGITVEIDGDVTGLNKALSSVNTSIKSTSSQLKDVEKLLKLDPTNTELLAQEQYDALQREIIETEEKLKDLEEQAEQSATSLQKIAATGEKLESVGDSISSVGTKMLGVTAGVVALGTAAVTTAADFESAMANVEALISSSSTDLEGDMERLEAVAKEAGETTVYSATEAAEAMYYMGLAGWDCSEMVDGLSGVLNLAAASDMDLATATDIVTDYLTAFGMSASESETLVDKMAYAMSNSNTTTEQLGEAYKNCAATSTQLVYSLVDWLNSLDENTRQIIITVALVAAAIGPVLIMVGKVISSVGTIMTLIPKIVSLIGTAKTALTGLFTVMSANPITIIIAAIAALVAAFIYLWNNCEEFREFWINLWEAIKEAASAAWEVITAFLSSAWETIKTTAETVWNAISGFFSGIWEGMQSIVTTVVNAVSSFLSSAWSAMAVIPGIL